jgi:L-asparaginase
MNPDHWVTIAQIIEAGYDRYDGFVILHGTDTMSYTASALGFMLEFLQKPVIFTGSQLPIGDLRTDAKENLITAIQFASLKVDGRAAIREVCLYFENQLYRANRTTKVNAEHFEAFASPNYPPLAVSGVHLKLNSDYLWQSRSGRKLVVHHRMDTHVAILRLFPGLGSDVLGTILKIPGLKGLVLETYGAGNAPTDSWLLEALSSAIDGGLHIVNVTQCSGGSVNMGQYETSEQLQKIKLINGRDITTEAAITKLMYMLGSEVSHKAFKTIFETSLRGEMS